MDKKANERVVSLSIIIPAYNVESVVARCLDSILVQKFESLDVICIDDGSTDDTLKILRKYAETDKRVRVFSQENKGVSAARNRGLELADGKYVSFIDADDIVAETYCERLYSVAEGAEADIVVFSGESEPKTPWINQKLKTRACEYYNNSFFALVHEGGSRPFSCNKLYRNDLIKQNHIRFIEGLKLGEDQAFIFMAFPYAKKIIYIEDKLYFYLCNREDSAMNILASDWSFRMEQHIRIVEAIANDWLGKSWMLKNNTFFIDWCVPFIYDDLARTSYNLRIEIIKRLLACINHCGGETSNTVVKQQIRNLEIWLKQDGQVPDVSVIIPVYNVEKYLDECLESVTRQSHFNIEIICVDDGSTDNSLQILDEQGKKDKRIKVLHQQNQYAGAARNKGMKAATGKYLLFLDSDDVFDKHLVEHAFFKAEKDKAEVCLFDFSYLDDKTKNIYNEGFSLRTEFLPQKTPFSFHQIPERVFSITTSCPWNKLFLRQFIEDEKLEFQDKRTANDVWFVNVALIKANAVTFVNEKLVFYRVNLSNNLQSVKKHSPLDFYEAYLSVKEEMISTGVYCIYEKSFVNTALSNCMYHLRTLKDGKAFAILYNTLRDEGFDKLGISGHDKSFFYIEDYYNEYQRMMSQDVAEYLFAKLQWCRSELQKEREKGFTPNKAANINVIDALKSKDDEIKAIRSSWSYRIGQKIIFIPGKIKRMLKK